MTRMTMTMMTMTMSLFCRWERRVLCALYTLIRTGGSALRMSTTTTKVANCFKTTYRTPHLLPGSVLFKRNYSRNLKRRRQRRQEASVPLKAITRTARAKAQARQSTRVAYRMTGAAPGIRTRRDRATDRAAAAAAPFPILI